MKKFIAFIAIFFSFTLFSYEGYKNIDSRQAYELVKKGALFIDVRTTKEYKRGHAKGAKLIPLYDEKDGKIEPNLNLVKEVEYLTDDNYDKPIVVICRSGHRSAKASQMLSNAGFTNVYNVVGGFLTNRGWLAYHLPIEK